MFEKIFFTKNIFRKMLQKFSKNKNFETFSKKKSFLIVKSKISQIIFSPTYGTSLN